MNKKTLRSGRFVGCLLALGIAYQTSADTLYVAAKISGGYATMEDITDKGSIGTGLPVNGIIDGNVAEEDFDDYVYGLGFSIGRRIIGVA